MASEVADYLRRELLVSDKYAGGVFIREEELARELNISRAPVREALRELEGQGLVRAIPRKGSMVLSFSPAEVEELYDIRLALENQIFEALIAQNLLSEEDYDELHRLFSELLTVASSSIKRTEKTLAFSKIDLEFHLYIAERAERPWTFKILRGVYYQIHQAMIQYLAGEELVYSAREHQKIIHSLKERNLEALRKSRYHSYFVRRTGCMEDREPLGADDEKE